MSLNVALAIIVNLVLVLAVVGGVAAMTILRLVKDKNALTKLVQRTRKSLKDALHSETEKENTPEAENKEEDKFMAMAEAASNASISQLKSLDEQYARQLALLSSMKEESETGVNNARVDEMIAESNAAALTISNLKSDLSKSRSNTLSLAKKVKSDRNKLKSLNVVKASEMKLREQVKKLMIRASTINNDAAILDDYNNSHKNTEAASHKGEISELKSTTLHQKKRVQELAVELEAAIKKEHDILQEIESLEASIENGPNAVQVKPLQVKLDEYKQDLERAIREKKILETHLHEMDMSLNASHEMSRVLERTIRENETLENFINDLYPGEADSKESVADTGSDKNSASEPPKAVEKVDLPTALVKFGSSSLPEKLAITGANAHPVPDDVACFVSVTVGDGSMDLLLGVTDPLQLMIASSLNAQPSDELSASAVNDALYAMAHDVVDQLVVGRCDGLSISAPQLLSKADAGLMIEHSSSTEQVSARYNKEPMVAFIFQ